MAKDTMSKTFFVAFALCVVCSVLVSAAAVVLKPTQAANKLADKKKNILSAAGLVERRKEGSWVFVTLGDAALVDPVLAALDDEQTESLS